MNTNGLTRLSAGDPPFVPNAHSWNAAMDAAEREAQRRHAILPGPAHKPDRDTGVIGVRNGTGANLHQLSILGLSAPLFTPTSDTNYSAAEREARDLSFRQRRIIMRGVSPTASYEGKFAVLLAPALDGEIVPAAIDGIVQCTVKMLDEDHRQADVLAGDVTMLSSRSSGGSADLVWIQPVDDREIADEALCLVRLGRGRAGEEVFVWVKKDGGSAGGVGTQCSFTYSIWPEGADVGDTSLRLATALTPTSRRWAIGEYLQAPDGTLGRARLVGGAWELLVAFREVLNPEPCEE